MRIVYAVLVALAFAGMVDRGQAAETPSSQLMLSVTPEQMSRFIQELGYPAQIQTHEKGTKRIRVSTVTSYFLVYFYTCDQRDNCRSIGITAHFENKRKNAVTFANDWNREKRFAKVYIDKQNQLRLEYDFHLHHGITVGNIKAYVDLFMDQFTEILGALEK